MGCNSLEGSQSKHNKKCFRTAEILNDNLEVVELTSNDPFLGADEATSLESLISILMGTGDSCSVDQYVNGDNNLEVCVNVDVDQWEEDFLENLTQDVGPDSHNEEEFESDDDDFDIPPPSPKMEL